jgi:hypothetical protein
MYFRLGRVDLDGEQLGGDGATVRLGFPVFRRKHGLATSAQRAAAASSAPRVVTATATASAHGSAPTPTPTRLVQEGATLQGLASAIARDDAVCAGQGSATSHWLPVAHLRPLRGSSTPGQSPARQRSALVAKLPFSHKVLSVADAAALGRSALPFGAARVENVVSGAAIIRQVCRLRCAPASENGNGSC